MQDNWGHGRTPSLIADKANETQIHQGAADETVLYTQRDSDLTPVDAVGRHATEMRSAPLPEVKENDNESHNSSMNDGSKAPTETASRATLDLGAKIK